LESGGFRLDRARNEAHLPDQSVVRLTPLEVRLLETLLLNAGHVVANDQLIGIIWGADGGDRNMLKQLVYRLRTKIEPNPAQPTLIETIPGVGYVFTA
jgi:DNA-binding response OmpR family regulator